MGRLYQIYGLFAFLCVYIYVLAGCRGLKYRRSLIVALLANLLFIFIGYKHISMPILTWSIMGGIGLPLIIYGIMYDTNIALIIATIYLPYNLIFPATFGGIQPALNATNIILVALVAGLFIGGKGNRTNNAKRNPVVILVLIFSALSLLAFLQGGLVYRGGYFGRFFFSFKRWLTPFIVFYLFYKHLPDRKVIKIIFAIAMLTIIANIYFGLLQWVNLGFGMYSERKYRLGGFNLHPNYFGAFIAYYLPFLVGTLLFEYRKISGKFLLFPILLGLRVIIPVNSRGSWIALPPAFLTIGFFRGKLLIPLAVLAVLLVLAFPEILIPQAIQDRFQAAIDIRPQDDIYAAEQMQPGQFISESRAISFRVRWILLQGGLRMLQSRPWFGYGWSTFPYLVGDYTEGGVRGTAHNMWLKIACEMGLAGLISIMAVFVFLFKAGIYVLRREKDPMLKGMALGLLGSIPALIVNNLTGSRLDSVDLTITFWIISACTVRMKEINRSERNLSAQGLP
jgi:O-antigen ligase